MTVIAKARMAAVRDDGIVVFLIGMRINSWLKIHQWLPVTRAMPKMLRELMANPSSGLLGSTFALTSQGPLLVQYWESTEKLMAYASDRTSQHYPAWSEFNRRVGTNGNVGIWHETYAVPRGHFEAIYVNMPAIGLGKVSRLEPAQGKLARARDRLLADAEPAAARGP